MNTSCVEAIVINCDLNLVVIYKHKIAIRIMSDRLIVKTTHHAIIKLIKSNNTQCKYSLLTKIVNPVGWNHNHLKVLNHF